MNRLKYLFWLTVCSPFWSSGQGLFQKFPSWEAVCKAAKTSGKGIFIDAYATWCVPCGIMDTKVYTVDSVQQTLRHHYICIKLPFDEKGIVGDSMEAWRGKIAQLQNTYHIMAFPTMLFLDSKGRPLHKAVAYHAPGDLVEEVRMSLDTDRQYYTFLDRYHRGFRDYARMPLFINMARNLRDVTEDSLMACDFIDHYLLTRGGTREFERGNLYIMASHIYRSTTPAFSFFYSNKATIDQVMGAGFASGPIDYILWMEVIKPILDATLPGNQPDWEKAWEELATRFPLEDAGQNILGAKMAWYKYKQQWEAYVPCVVQKVERYGVEGGYGLMWNLNNFAWDIFLHSTDTVALRMALAWSDSTIHSKGAQSIYLDTDANLLYKLGDIHDALIVEERAAQMPNADKGIKEVMEKMRKGVPTW